MKLPGKLSQKVENEGLSATATSSTEAATTSPYLIPSGILVLRFWTHLVN